MERSVQRLFKQNLLNLFASWKNVAKEWKDKRLKYLECSDNIGYYNKRLAVELWLKRTRATKQARLNCKRMKAKYILMRQRLIFEAWKRRNSEVRFFYARLFNFGNINDHQAARVGFSAIASFAKSKEFVMAKRKEHSSKDSYDILQSLYKKKLLCYMKDLQSRTRKRYDIERSRS